MIKTGMEAVDELILDQLKSFQGRKVEIHNLQSQKTLNGQTGLIVGFDQDKALSVQERRLHCRLDNDPSRVIRVKMANVTDTEELATYYSTAGQTSGMRATTRGERAPLSDTELLKLFQQAIRGFSRDSSLRDGGREDIVARYNYAVTHVLEGNIPPPLKCLEDMVPPEQQNEFLKRLSAMKFKCHRRDGQVDFHRFNALLKPRMCEEDYEEKIVTRLKEWFVSGMCETCQSKLFESMGDY